MSTHEIPIVVAVKGPEHVLQHRVDIIVPDLRRRIGVSAADHDAIHCHVCALRV